MGVDKNVSNAVQSKSSKKSIKIKESDVVNIVKRIIKENKK